MIPTRKWMLWRDQTSFVLELFFVISVLIQLDSGIGMPEFKTKLLSFIMLLWVSCVIYETSAFQLPNGDNDYTYILSFVWGPN